MTSCVQGAGKAPDVRSTTASEKSVQGIDWMPYLTKEGNFVYVDKKMNKKLPGAYTHAAPFLSTGYALVQDGEGRSALIDTAGNFIIDYTENTIELMPVSNFTLMMTVREYEKTMPVWKWEMNILGDGIKKQQTYHRVEIRSVESDQLILSKDVSYDEDDFSLHYSMLNDTHIVLNDFLYEIKNKKLKKIKEGIAYTLDEGRYIPYHESRFNLYDIRSNQPLLADFVGTTQLQLDVNNQPLLLDSINMDRYAPVVPKLLQGGKDKDVYVFPQYDKAFPKQIKHATAEQLTFLKEAGFVYSVNNSPYFIIGRFNDDHAVWAYDWLYIDVQGNLLNEIQVDDFYITDQIGYMVWPDKYMLFSDEVLSQDLGKLKSSYVSNSDSLYIVKTQLENEPVKEGLWNAKRKSWEMQPNYYAIHMLDDEHQIFAIQKESEGKFYLYNNKTKSEIVTQGYTYIYSSGLVRLANENKDDTYFYIDIPTGVEYRAL